VPGVFSSSVTGVLAVAKKYVSKLVGRVIRDAEALHKANAVTFESQFDNPKKLTSPGGMCSCCGAGPRVTDANDWWLVFKAGLCDGDGVFYSMLCGGCDGSGCLEEIRHENAKRTPTFRDEMAEMISLINGDDVDGMEADMDDGGFMMGFDD
jgi:hypothetical protein